MVLSLHFTQNLIKLLAKVRLAQVDMQMLEEVKMKTLFLFRKILNYIIDPPISKND